MDTDKRTPVREMLLAACDFAEHTASTGYPANPDATADELRDQALYHFAFNAYARLSEGTENYRYEAHRLFKKFMDLRDVVRGGRVIRREDDVDLICLAFERDRSFIELLYGTAVAVA